MEAMLTFSIEECPSCGIPFAVTNLEQTRLRESKDTFYCPRGHSQSYRKGTADLLREQLEASRKTVARQQEDINRIAAEKQAAENEARRLRQKRRKSEKVPKPAKNKAL
jgi:hypothetical protein